MPPRIRQSDLQQSRRGKNQTTHHPRWEWFYERTTFPLRDAPPTEIERIWKNPGPDRIRGEPKWDAAGPFNVSGRVTSLAVDRNRPEIIYAGSAGGGVWRSQDAGETWQLRWPRFANHNIGALVLHPRECDRIIVATGEANMSPDSYPGSGFFTSIDGGENWRDFFTLPDGTSLPLASMDEVPRRVGTIAFDPHDILYGAVGSVTHHEQMPAGLYLIKNDEGLVPCRQFGMRSYNCFSVVFHPAERGLLFAAIELRGSASGIWRSEDSGEHWVQLKSGLPCGEEFGRTSLAIAPSDLHVVYALAADRNRRLLGIFRSSDYGVTWQNITEHAKEVFTSERFMSYNNTIAIDPDDSGCVIWGGMHLYRTLDAGGSWEKITTNERFEPDNRSVCRTNYVHEDHHALVFSNGNIVYSGNDSGVSVSHNRGFSWTQKSRGMMTTMFYDVDVAPSNSKVFGGGCQDNGTLIAGVNGQKEGDFIQAFPGDGGWVVFDPTDEERVFGSAQNMDIRRHVPHQLWDFGWTAAAPSPEVLSEGEKNLRAITVLAIEPGKPKGPRKIWAGTHRLWRGDNGGAEWTPVVDSFDGSAISAIEISEVEPSIMYVGTSKGGIYRSTDGGSRWTNDLASVDIPRRLITRIKAHPKRAATAVLTVASTGLAGVKLKRSAPSATGGGMAVIRETETHKPYSHVFQTDDLGVTWRDLEFGSLPNVVYHAAAFEAKDPYSLFIAGDAGVWLQFRGGWLLINGNLPNVVISDLVFHGKDEVLTAATYGRGIWRLPMHRLRSWLNKL